MGPLGHGRNQVQAGNRPQTVKEAVEPKVSTFPTPSEVMTTGYPTSKFFIVSDLASGYHQIKIQVSDHYSFGFLLEDRVYLYSVYL